jgi:hypothetical protein
MVAAKVTILAKSAAALGFFTNQPLSAFRLFDRLFID